MIGAGGSSALNLYGLDSLAGRSIFTDNTGYTTKTAALVGGETTLVFVTLGQSLIATSQQAGEAFTPVNGKVHQLNIADGVVYEGKDPQFGTSAVSSTSGSFLPRLGDKFITNNKAARVIFINCAVGGSSVGDWATGFLNHRLTVSLLRARQNAYPITAILWQQGQTEAALSTTQQQYQDRFAIVKDTARGLGYGSVPWFVAKCTMLSSSTNSTIQAAQAALWSGTTLQGPDVDTDVVAGNRWDGTHPNATGNPILATSWYNKIVSGLSL